MEKVKEIIIERPVEVIKEVIVEKPVEVIKEIPVTTIVYKDKIIEIEKKEPLKDTRHFGQQF